MFDVEAEHFADGRRAAAEILRFAVRSAIAGREPRLYAIGRRFGDGREHRVPELSELRRRLVTDGREVRGGVFTVVRFKMEKSLARIVERVDPAALERRLAEAAGKAVHDRLGWAEGILHVSHGRGGPEVVALLSARRSDGGPARTLGPVDVQGLQAAWHARSYDAMAVRRDLHELGPDTQIRVWKQATETLQRALGGRINGEASREQFVAASAQVDRARHEWRSALPTVTEAAPGPLRTIRLALPDGAAHFAALDSFERREVLQLAVERVAREVTVPALGVTEWASRDGRDLHVLVSYNETPGVSRRTFAEALATRLAPAVAEEAARHGRWSPDAPLGRVIQRQTSPVGAPHGDSTTGAERRFSLANRPAVRFRLERGGAYLAAFPENLQRQILAQAARRAFPGAWANGAKPTVGLQREGNALVARLLVPTSPSGPVPDLRPPPEAQARFVNEVYRAGAELQGTLRKDGLLIAPAKVSAVRRQTAAAVTRVPLVALPNLGLGRIGLAIPAAFRIARGVSRVMGALLPARED